MATAKKKAAEEAPVEEARIPARPARPRRAPALRLPLGRRRDHRGGAFRGEHTEPAIQLLHDEGHSGEYGIRFCYYSLDGRFQRSPMMIDSSTNLDGLRDALKRTPKLRALLKKLVS